MQFSNCSKSVQNAVYTAVSMASCTKRHDLLFLPCCVSDTGPPTGSDALTADLTTDGRPYGQVAKTHVQLRG